MKSRYLIIGLFIVIVDQIVKLLVINKNSTIIPNFLSITFTENTGAAFGVGTRYIIIILSLLIIVGLFYITIKHKDNIISYIPFMLIISGAVSNLIDRFFRGFVIDYIDINIFNFPNFNIADISITIGIFSLIYFLITKEKNDHLGQK